MSRQKPGQIGQFWLSQNRHGTWCRTWFDNETRQTRRVAVGAPDFESAVIALAKWYVLEQELDKESPADIPVGVALERYLDKHGKDLASSDAIARAVKKLKKFFADDTVAELTLDRQNEFERDLRAQGYADAYIARIQTTLKAALNRSHENHELASVPYIRVASSKVTRDRLLALPEAAALFNANPPEHLFRFLVLAFNTLSRPEALFELQPFQANLEHRLLALNPPIRMQTKKWRPTVPVTDTLLPWLREWSTSRYYIQWFDGQTEPIDSIKTTWRRVRVDAEALLKEADAQHGGLGDVVPYTIRHTMATELRRRGVPQWEIAGMLGHHTGGTSEVYAKYAPDYLGKAAAAIDDYMNELQPLVKRELIRPLAPAPKRHLTVVK
jgi:integrase